MTATIAARTGGCAADGSNLALAPWVELRQVPDSGHARAAWLLVNRRTTVCLGLTEATAQTARCIPPVGESCGTS
jgi:hypothetical protein